MATKRIDLIIAARDQFSKTLKTMDRSLDGILGKHKMIVAAAAASAAALTAAYAAAIKQTYELLDSMAAVGDRMDKMSQRTGVAVDELQRWDYVVQLGGATGEQFEAALKRLARAIYDADRGVKESREAFEKLGVNIYDSEGRLRSVNEIMYDVADGMKNANSETERMGLALVVLGRGGTQILPTLKQGSDAIREQMAELERLGGVMSDDFTAAAAGFIDSQLRARTAWNNFKAALTEPGLELAADFINGIAESLGTLADEAKANEGEIAAAFESMLRVTISFSEGLLIATEGFAKFGKVAIDVADALANLGFVDVGPIGEDARESLDALDNAVDVLQKKLKELQSTAGETGRAMGASFGGKSGRRGGVVGLLPETDTRRLHGTEAAPDDSFDADKEMQAIMDFAMTLDTEGGKAMDKMIAKMADLRQAEREVAKTAQTVMVNAMADAMTQMIMHASNAGEAIKGIFSSAFASIASSYISFGITKLFGLPFSAGGMVPAMAGGGTIPRAYAGYSVPDGPRGMDSRLILGMPGEEVISRSLSQRLDRFLATMETAQTYAPATLAGGAGGGKIEVHYHGGMPVKRSDFVRLQDDLVRAAAEAGRRVL